MTDLPLYPDAKVLIIDDEPANVHLLQMLLTNSGYRALESTTDSREAVDLFQRIQPDIVLLDLSMPHLDGFEVMARLQGLILEDDFLPIVILTAIALPETKRKALAAGAHDFVTKPFDAVEVLLRIRNLLQTRHLHRSLKRYSENLDALVKERTAELRQALVELRDAQRQLVHEERLRALALMASGIAHDFNNTLSVILGFGEIVLMECEQDPHLERQASAMREVITATQDAAKMVSRLREFSHPVGDEVQQLIDLGNLARQVVRLTEPRWRTQARGAGAEIEVVCSADVAVPVIGDPAELREGLTNLIFNAVDAMPQGGRITVRCVAEGSQCVLEVSDTGTGMPEEIRQRCLEPFFTTKGRKGTGLGLAMVHGIIQRHQGELAISSELGRGTTFTMRFPLAELEPEDGAVPTRRAEPLRILVVDDQELVRDIIAELLAQDLHSVDLAGDAEQALELFRNKPFDVVITDLGVPGKPGVNLIAEIKKAAPALPVFLLSGFGEGDELTAQTGADVVLAKPVSRDVLRRALAEVVPQPANVEHGVAVEASAC